MKFQVCHFAHLKRKVPIRHPSKAVEEALGIRGLEFREKSELKGQIWELSAYTWNLSEGG